MGLRDKVAIVPGASKGIGKAIALELTQEGCQVVLCARGEEDLQAAIREVEQVGYALSIAADVTKPNEVEKLVEETIASFGK
ncbi:MAG: SDR family NAD(P)-dependent oxidoreductase, partial [Rubrobacter sp.]|nr:SDR family NAD(P)-dependent oxidoreductase [Rubrobacter sp.]